MTRRQTSRPIAVVLVGHFYGGAVITEAGNDPGVAGLVYITAFCIVESKVPGPAAALEQREMRS